MTELQKNLDDLGASDPVRRLAATIADRATISSHQVAGYVGLRPAMEDKAMALYLHREYASIVLPASRATAEQPRFPGARIRHADKPVWHLVLPEAALREHFDAAVELAVEAVEWRATGPKASLGGHPQQAQKSLKICPSCHMQLLPSGVCAECG